MRFVFASAFSLLENKNLMISILKIREKCKFSLSNWERFSVGMLFGRWSFTVFVGDEFLRSFGVDELV